MSFLAKSCWTTHCIAFCLCNFNLKAYDIYLLPFRILGNTNKITLRLKVASPTGILLWSGGDHFSAASDYLLLGVKDGHLQFRCVRLQCHVTRGICFALYAFFARFNLGNGEGLLECNASRIDDGLWHRIRATR